MALKIRLRQQGRTNAQTYRLVVADIRSPRDGKYIEMLGWYNPALDKENVAVNEERVNYWLSQGAQLTNQAKSVISKVAPALIKEHQVKAGKQRTKLCQKRRERRKA